MNSTNSSRARALSVSPVRVFATWSFLSVAEDQYKKEATGV
ncbi:hypothetical protein V9K92_02530 [Phyllobacterium sp. CCNWLW109]